MKEHLDGYVMERDYKVTLKTLTGKVEQEIPLQHTYEFKSPFDANTTIKLTHNYTASLRSAMFADEAADKQDDGLDF